MFEVVSLLLTLVVLVLSSTSTTTENPDVKQGDDAEHFNIIVTMKESNSPVLNRISGRSFPTREERLNSVAKEAQEFAAKSQASLLDFLSMEGQSRATTGKVPPDVTSLWITNQISITNADAALIKELSNRPDVVKIQLSRSIDIDLDLDLDLEDMEEPADDPESSEGDSDDGEDGPWGIENLNVPLVWAKGIRGEGVLVANMDTGVNLEHESLRSNYIGEGGWLDVGREGNLVPTDKGGHGTGTMSVIAGTTRNIGVAPGVKWMACGEVVPYGTPHTDVNLIRCAQWLVCPGGKKVEPGADPDPDPGAGQGQVQVQNCSGAPHVINHSWSSGYSRADSFDKAILYYHAAGIIPIFSAANSGPDCSNLGYPGAFSYVLSIGALRKDNKVWTRSARGPPDHDVDLIKPDLVAPGHLVRRAGNTTDTSYKSKSGTSYAAPYVTGVVALMLSKNPQLTFKQVKEILLASTVPTLTSGESCGEKRDDEFPNFIAGYGRLDANKAIEYMDTMET